MPNTPIEIPKLTAGLTLTCDIYPRGSEVADETGIVLTEETNRKGTYSGVVSAASSGLITIKINSGTTLLLEITSTIQDTTDTFILEDEDRMIEAL